MAKAVGKLRIAFPNRVQPGQEQSFEKRLPVIFMTKNLKNKMVCLAVVKNAAAGNATTDFVSAQVIVPITDQEIYTVNLALSAVQATDDCTLFAAILKGPSPPVPDKKDFIKLACPRVKVKVHRT